MFRTFFFFYKQKKWRLFSFFFELDDGRQLFYEECGATCQAPCFGRQNIFSDPQNPTSKLKKNFNWINTALIVSSWIKRQTEENRKLEVIETQTFRDIWKIKRQKGERKEMVKIKSKRFRNTHLCRGEDINRDSGFSP